MKLKNLFKRRGYIDFTKDTKKDIDKLIAKNKKLRKKLKKRKDVLKGKAYIPI